MSYARYLDLVGLVGELFNNVERKPFDVVERKRKPYCGKYTMYSCQSGKFWRSRCGQRSCSCVECRNSYAGKRQAQIQALCEDNGLNRFFTLTVNPRNFKDDMEAWENISYIWSKFRKRLAREYPNCKWVCVLEKHHEGEGENRDDCDEQEEANNRPHIHGFSSEWIDVKWMTTAWEEAGGGSGVKIKWVWGTPADYVCKELAVSRYCTKDSLDVGDFVKPYQKIFWASQGLVKRPKKKSEGYGFVAKQIVGLSGKTILAESEICDILNGDIRDKHKGVKGYEERSKWFLMETTFSEISTRRSEKGISYLASYGGRQEESESRETFARSKDEDKCPNQETERKLVFGGFDYDDNTESKPWADTTGSSLGECTG